MDENLILINVDHTGARTVKYGDGIRVLYPQTSCWKLDEVTSVFDSELNLSGNVCVDQGLCNQSLHRAIEEDSDGGFKWTLKDFIQTKLCYSYGG